ncbi:MAG TPA: superoxide dismutase, partial [Thermoleophilia bacterium]|nr:superoxide dismutase [Thermoleophilia bacterium]
MAFELPQLPWAEDALEPVYSARTVSFHYGKHHKAYVDKLNELAAGTPYADMKLEDVIKDTAGKTDKTAVFNNAAQVWNHTFFWHSMKPGGGGKPGGDVGARIDAVWGSFEKFVDDFKTAALARFGSGWVWLVAEGGELKIVHTPNAETPLTTAATPLVT